MLNVIRNWAAHELLETTELLRKLKADIKLCAFCAETTTDSRFKQMLRGHMQMMDETYHRGIDLLQNKGADVTYLNAQRAPAQPPPVPPQEQRPIPAPNRQATGLSEMTMMTLLLNTHKAGAVFGMQWANECVDPHVRSLHVVSANNCQQMAYEIWQYMNERGFYQAPSMPNDMVRSMAQLFQPSGTVINQPLGYEPTT